MLQLKMNELSIEKIFEDRQIDEKWLNASRADFLPASMLFNMERALTLIKTHLDKKWVIVNTALVAEAGDKLMVDTSAWTHTRLQSHYLS